MLGWIRSELIPMFKKIGPEFKCRKDIESEFWTTFRKIGPEFQCLQNYGQYSNVRKDIIRETHLSDAAGMCTLHGLN